MPPYKIARSDDPDALSTEEQTIRLARARVDEWREQGLSPVITDLADNHVLNDDEVADLSKREDQA